MFWKILILIIISTLSFADMSRVYIGNENGQLFVGAEKNVVQTNIDNSQQGAANIDLRYFFRKNGIIVEDHEYMSKPGRTEIILGVAGINETGSMITMASIWDYSKDTNYDDVTIEQHYVVGSGVAKGISGLTTGSSIFRSSSCH